MLDVLVLLKRYVLYTISSHLYFYITSSMSAIVTPMFLYSSNVSVVKFFGMLKTNGLFLWIAKFILIVIF